MTNNYFLSPPENGSYILVWEKNLKLQSVHEVWGEVGDPSISTIIFRIENKVSGRWNNTWQFNILNI